MRGLHGFERVGFSAECVCGLCAAASLLVTKVQVRPEELLLSQPCGCIVTDVFLRWRMPGSIN